MEKCKDSFEPLISARRREIPRETRRSAWVGRLPGNLIYKGQLLEKRDNGVVEALGVGYFFSIEATLSAVRTAVVHT